MHTWDDYGSKTAEGAKFRKRKHPPWMKCRDLLWSVDSGGPWTPIRHRKERKPPWPSLSRRTSRFFSPALNPPNIERFSTFPISNTSRWHSRNLGSTKLAPRTHMGFTSPGEPQTTRISHSTKVRARTGETTYIEFCLCLFWSDIPWGLLFLPFVLRLNLLPVLLWNIYFIEIPYQY